MKAQNVSKSELASRLGVRASMVARLLSGQNNLELSTLVRIAMALNCRFRGQLCPVEKNSTLQSAAKPKYSSLSKAPLTFAKLENELLQSIE